jgi:hypothetical protein
MDPHERGDRFGHREPGIVEARAMPHVNVRWHAIPKTQAKITAPLVWQRGEMSVLALRTLVGSLPKQKS